MNALGAVEVLLHCEQELSVVRELGQVALGPNPTPIPLGAVLGSSSPLRVEEEELYRAGLRIRRLVRRVRWSDGSVHVWFARRAGPGRGESSSGLRFDSAETE